MNTNSAISVIIEIVHLGFLAREVVKGVDLMVCVAYPVGCEIAKNVKKILKEIKD